MFNSIIMILISLIFVYIVLGFFIIECFSDIEDPINAALGVVFWPLVIFIFFIAAIVDLILFFLTRKK